jgi:HSP20 family molecular chaperone IbpA
MSEENKSHSKHYLLSALVIFLIGFAGVQTWYMINMKHKLDAISATDQTSINNTDVAQADPSPLPKATPQIQHKSVAPGNPASQSKQSIPDNPLLSLNDDFFNHPFANGNWNPNEMIKRMQQDMDRVFNNMPTQFDNSPNFGAVFNNSDSIAQLNMKEDNSKFTLTMDLPGAKENNVSVNLDGQQLTVSGEQDFDQQKKDAQGNVIFQQHRTGQFERSVTLPEPVKPGSLVSHVDNGVLTITVNKLS